MSACVCACVCACACVCGSVCAVGGYSVYGYFSADHVTYSQPDTLKMVM